MYTLDMNILCDGCSFTYGAGFLDHERESKIWPGLLANEINGNVTNISFPGSSNHEIFVRTLRELQNKHYDLVILQWSELRRHWFHPGLDRFYICAGDTKDFTTDWSNKDIYIKSKARKVFYDTLTMLTGDYRASLDLATYCQTLKNLQSSGQKIIFVNGLLPWGSDLIYPPSTTSDLEKYFSQFIKDMLEFIDRDDDEILKYYYKLHYAIKPTLSNWVNVDNSWQDNCIDTATLGHHPGPKSHKWLATQIQNYLINQ